mgnify:CR=1 FL=1
MEHSRLLIFPHQLFASHPGLKAGTAVTMVEDNLFFGGPRHIRAFHKQKLWLHRASMMRYADRLRQRGHPVDYIHHRPEGGTLHRALGDFARAGGTGIVVAETHDDLLGLSLIHI